MATALRDLPEYLVLAPESTLRVDMHLDEPSCEINVALDNPRPGRSFVLLIGHPGGPYVQRVRLAGRARIFFDPKSPGDYVLLLANPETTPVVLRLKVRGIAPSRPRARAPASARHPRRSRSRSAGHGPVGPSGARAGRSSSAAGPHARAKG